MKQFSLVSLVWLPLLALSSCGSSEPDDSESKSDGGAQNSGASGSGATSGLAGSSGASVGTGGAAGEATGNPGGRGGRGGSTSGGATGGSPDGGGAGASAGKAGESGGGNADGPDVPPQTLLDDLDETQKAVICDWNAELLGGYGHVDQCGMGPRVFFADQAECVMYAFNWDCEWVTVQNFAECAVAQKASGGCDRPSEQCSWQFCR